MFEGKLEEVSDDGIVIDLENERTEACRKREGNS